MKEITNRRSIRKYKNTPIEKENIMTILEAARLAPSGSNTQPWRFLVVTDQEIKKKIVEIDHNQQWMLQAPVFIVCMADLSSRTGRKEKQPLSENASSAELKLVIRDTAIAVSHILLECEHLGLGSCWTGWYEQEKMHQVLNVPKEFYISGVVTIGYADEIPQNRPRKAMEEIVRFNEWE